LKNKLLLAVFVFGLTSCTSTAVPTTTSIITPAPTETITPTIFYTPIPRDTPTPTRILTTATVTPTSTSWLTYTNAEFGFALDYPPNMALETQSEQIVLSTDPDSPWYNRWYLRVERNYTPADALYFLDMTSNGQTTTGQTTWTTYYLPEGYCDGPGCSPPIYAVRAEFNHVLYTAFFYNQSSLAELQTRILSTFRLLQ